MAKASRVRMKREADDRLKEEFRTFVPSKAYLQLRKDTEECIELAIRQGITTPRVPYPSALTPKERRMYEHEMRMFGYSVSWRPEEGQSAIVDFNPSEK